MGLTIRGSDGVRKRHCHPFVAIDDGTCLRILRSVTDGTKRWRCSLSTPSSRCSASRAKLTKPTVQSFSPRSTGTHSWRNPLGPALVDHLDPREVHDHRRLSRDQVDDTVDGRSRGAAERADERCNAVLGIVSEVHQQRIDGWRLHLGASGRTTAIVSIGHHADIVYLLANNRDGFESTERRRELSAPIDVPTMASGRIPRSRRAWSMPTWVAPRLPPPASAKTVPPVLAELHSTSVIHLRVEATLWFVESSPLGS